MTGKIVDLQSKNFDLVMTGAGLPMGEIESMSNDIFRVRVTLEEQPITEEARRAFERLPFLIAQLANKGNGG